MKINYNGSCIIMVHGICRINCLEVTRARGAIESDFVNRVLIQSIVN